MPKKVIIYLMNITAHLKVAKIVRYKKGEISDNEGEKRWEDEV